MPEHILYGSQVGTSFNEVSGKGMAKGVWAHILFNTCLTRAIFNNIEYHYPAQASASAVQKNQMPGFGFYIVVMATNAFQVKAEVLERLFSDRNQSFFIPLTDDLKEPHFPVDLS